MKKIYIAFLILLSTNLFSQEKIDLTTSLLRQPKVENPSDYVEYIRKAENEIEFIYSGIFVFYKSYISSQDGSTCSFHPSCSEYAVQALKKFGAAKGGLMFFDRYTRCNSLSPNSYKIDEQKQKLIDKIGEF